MLNFLSSSTQSERETDGSGELGLVLNGEFDQGVTAVQLQLVADIRPMILDGAHADSKLGSNLFTGPIAGQKGEHAPLGRAQLGKGRALLGERGSAARTFEQMGGKRRADVTLSRKNGSDATDHLDHGAVFHDVTLDPQAQRFVEVQFVAMHRQENDLHRQAGVTHAPSNAESIPHRHIDIEQGNIGQYLSNSLERALSVTGFRHHLQPALFFEHMPQTVPENGVIISDHDADFSFHARFWNR